MSFIPGEITFGDGPQLSAFGKLKVTTSHTVFDYQSEYGLDTLRMWDATANGTLSSATPATDGSVTNGSNAVGPTNATTRLTPITVSSTNGHYSILQSRQYCRYIPGKGHTTYITGIFATGGSATAKLVLRSSCSGSASDAMFAAQADWSEDSLDGTGKSGVNIDFTKVQIMIFDAQMLYAGRVRIGFDVGGLLIWAHYFEIANEQILPTMQTYNLPVRLEARTGASTTIGRVGYFDSENGIFLETSRAVTGGTINLLCCSVQNDGEEELRGFPLSSPASISTVGVTTRRPILSLRPKATYNSRTNRAHIEQLEYLIRATTNDSLVEIVIGGSLTGAAWTSVGSASVSEYDTTANAIAGGLVIRQGFALSGSGSNALSLGGEVDARGPLTLSQIDALTATQPSISIVCTSFSGTSNVTPIMNWHEQVV